MVDYHDPFVPRFREGDHERTGVALSDDALRGADAVVIVTDHKDVDYQRVVDLASIVVDTRNATAATQRSRARLVTLAAPTAAYELARPAAPAPVG